MALKNRMTSSGQISTVMKMNKINTTNEMILINYARIKKDISLSSFDRISTLS